VICKHWNLPITDPRLQQPCQCTCEAGCECHTSSGPCLPSYLCSSCLHIFLEQSDQCPKCAVVFNFPKKRETLGSLARHISDTQRKAKEHQQRDLYLQKRKEQIRLAKDALENKIIEAANSGNRRVTVLSLDSDGLIIRDDMAEKITCPHYQQLWDYLLRQDLLPELSSSKMGYGVYHYFLVASW